MSTRSELFELENRIGYHFKDIAVLDNALTHSSYANEHGTESNERLEFLGDSILNYIVSEKLYSTEKSAGEMTQLRSRIVSREPLALAVERLGAFKCLRLGEGAKKAENLSSKFISNIFEAILGAIYIDSGSLKECERFVWSNLDFGANTIDYKSKLQEYVQQRRLGNIVYETVALSLAKKPMFASNVFVGEANLGRGEGYSKKDAEKAAAKEALGFLKSR